MIFRLRTHREHPKLRRVRDYLRALAELTPAEHPASTLGRTGSRPLEPNQVHYEGRVHIDFIEPDVSIITLADTRPSSDLGTLLAERLGVKPDNGRRSDMSLRVRLALEVLDD